MTHSTLGHMLTLPLALLLSSCATSPAPEAPPAVATAPDRAPSGDLVEGQTAFALDLYARLAAKAGPDANVFISPVSVATAFGLLQLGTNGETERQIASVMRYPDELAPQMAAFARQVQSEEEGRLFALANAVFVEDDLALSPAYLSDVREYYGAEVPAVDFGGDPVGAEATINAWVEENTRGLIPTVYNGEVDTSWMLALVNTAYLKAEWADTFDKMDTVRETFDAPDGPVEVDMMRRTAVMPYAEGRGWHAIKLPYVGETMSMVVVVPTRGTVAALEARLDAPMLAAMEAGFANTSPGGETSVEVDLKLPRMDIGESYGLVKTLQAMGMRDAFAPAADFDGLYGRPVGNDQIGSVIHKTRLKVDEVGTEAAAVTAISIIVTGARLVEIDRRVEVHVDEPALVLIRHEDTGAVLFMGRITDPTG